MQIRVIYNSLSILADYFVSMQNFLNNSLESGLLRVARACIGIIDRVSGGFGWLQ